MADENLTFPLGAITSQPDARDIHFASVVPTADVLPAKFSHRSKQSPVVRQNYGSCEGFTAKDIIEWLNDGKAVSGRAGYAMCKEIDGKPNTEGTQTRVMLKVASGIGLPLDKFFPNVNTPTHQDYITGLSDEAREEAIQNRIGGFALCSSIQEIKTALFKGYPVAGTIVVYEDYLATDNKGKVKTPHPSNFVGTHEITFIGWDDTLGLEFKNHWGTSWGDDGYGFLPYNYLENNGNPFTEAYAIVDFVNSQLTAGAPIELQYPLDGPINITQTFGARPEYYAKYGMAGHNGIDLHASSGSHVYAADDGKVIFSGFKGSVNSGYGNYIMIQHSWGYSIYGHLESFVATDTGSGGFPQVVKKGQMIATSDNTGDSSAPHLHFGIRINGVTNAGYFDWVDPTKYLKKGQETMQLVKDIRSATVGIKTGNADKRILAFANVEALGLLGDEPQTPIDFTGIPIYNIVKNDPSKAGQFLIVKK